MASCRCTSAAACTDGAGLCSQSLRRGRPCAACTRAWPPLFFLLSSFLSLASDPLFPGSHCPAMVATSVPQPHSSVPTPTPHYCPHPNFALCCHSASHAPPRIVRVPPSMHAPGPIRRGPLYLPTATCALCLVLPTAKLTQRRPGSAHDAPSHPRQRSFDETGQPSNASAHSSCAAPCAPLNCKPFPLVCMAHPCRNHPPSCFIATRPRFFAPLFQTDPRPTRTTLPCNQAADGALTSPQPHPHPPCHAALFVAHPAPGT